jgi:hypothetical protein
VVATSARNAWAVGSTNSGRPLIAAWNGSTWTKVADPGFTGKGVLSAVAAVSASDAWAVGTTSITGGKTLILHWDGRSWQRVASPTPGAGRSGDQLVGVTASSGASAWAIGSTGSGRTLILHWNGSRWQQAPVSIRGGLFAVTMLSARSGWAVGVRDIGTSFNTGSLILRWDGTTWKRVPSPRVRAHFFAFVGGVTATSARSAWAVGDSTNCGCGPGLSLTWHWNGTTWKRVPSPSPGGGTSLTGVAAIPGSSDVWAAGVSGEGDSPTKTVILRWNGTAWKRVPSPSPRASSSLSGVAAVSPGLAWAVGSAGNRSSNGSTTVILRWDGKAWR